MPHRETPLNFQVTNWVLTRCSLAARSLDPLSGKNVFGRAWGVGVGSLLITREEKIEKEREREREQSALVLQPMFLQTSSLSSRTHSPRRVVLSVLK